MFITRGRNERLNPPFGEGSVFDLSHMKTEFDLSHMKTENIAKKLDSVDFLGFENDFSKVEI